MDGLYWVLETISTNSSKGLGGTFKYLHAKQQDQCLVRGPALHSRGSCQHDECGADAVAPVVEQLAQGRRRALQREERESGV